MGASPLAAGESGGAEFLPTNPLAEGKPVFQQKGCGACHGMGGARTAELTAPDLSRDAGSADVMQFAGGLWTHPLKGGAPDPVKPVRRPEISADEMGRLIDYVFFMKFIGEPGTAVGGKEVFTRASCVRCHQVAGVGGRVAPRLDDLKDVASAFFFAGVLWNHGPEMAAKMEELAVARPRLSGDDIAQIVAFIRGDAADRTALELAYAQAGSPQTGKAVFTDKGCITCHAPAGTGGSAAPDFGKATLPRTVNDMAAALWNHGPPMWAKMKELGVAYPRLSDRDMADVLSYLHYLQYTGARGDVNRGTALFGEKTCAGCHSVAGVGGKGGPDLARSKAVQSPARWAAAMWNHAMPTTAVRFEKDEMRDLLEFLRSRAASN